MKILNRFFPLVLMITIVLYGEEAPTPETQFTKGVHNRTSCQIECPPMKDGFISRKVSFTYESGKTLCNVYSLSNPTKSIATVINKNPHCSAELENPNNSKNINSNTGGVNSHLSGLKSNVSSLYTSTGSSTYLNLPNYMIAGLMADSDIIDIPTSISNNEVMLNSNYTISPNLVFGNSENILDNQLLSKSKDGLSGSITFVINFLSSSDKILMSFKVALFLFSVALSLILLLAQKGTKKISGVSDHEDFSEKILLGVVSILIFFLPLNKISTPTGDISQTGYQQLIRPLLYLGVDTADKLSVEATSAYLKYKFSSVGYVATKDLQSYENQKYSLEKKNTLYKEILPKWCESTYNIKELKTQSSLLGFNMTYPPSEDIYLKGYGTEEERAVTFYTKTMMNSEEFIKMDNIPTVSFCYNIERSVLENNALISDLSTKIKAFGQSGGLVEKKINALSDIVFKNVSEFGFLSVANLSTISIAFSNMELIPKADALKNVGNSEATIKEYRKATGYEVGDIQENEGFVDEALYSLVSEAPYYMLPFAMPLKTFVDSKVDPVADLLKGDSSLNPFSMIKGFLLNTVVGLTATYLKTKLVLWLLVTIVAVAPLVAMIGASFLVMSFYFLSIVVLYIIIPFASIFAFSTGNMEIIKNLIKHTFLLSIKPVLIVVSVLLALFAYELYNSFNSVLITSMFEPLFFLSNDIPSTGIVNGVMGYFNGLGLGMIFIFLKGLMLLVGSVVSTFVCFYLVFNGANIMLDLLGMKDGGFDVGNTIGDKVESKQTGQKGNTIGV